MGFTCKKIPKGLCCKSVTQIRQRVICAKPSCGYRFEQKFSAAKTDILWMFTKKQVSQNYSMGYWNFFFLERVNRLDNSILAFCYYQTSCIKLNDCTDSNYCLLHSSNETRLQIKTYVQISPLCREEGGMELGSCSIQTALFASRMQTWSCNRAMSLVTKGTDNKVPHDIFKD